MGKTCLKCGYADSGRTSPIACPSCGAIYAKVEAAVRAAQLARKPDRVAHTESPAPNSVNRRKVGPLLVVASVLVGVAGAYGAYSAYQQYSQHQAALAYCSAEALAVWEAKIKPSLEQYDRTIKAAMLAPRITLAPMILKLSEARAEVRKLTAPPPCAAEAFSLMLQSMQQDEDALTEFAEKAGDFSVGRAMREARETADEAIQKFAEARAKAVR